ncbi:V-type ATP synthase subunit A [Herbidospora yilanensis]|uniref:V-type ATP synthase subunit A n=1 Tax=Herbidospora yilanensis TaxID=354426 RepID=UPI000782AD52|nr:V-type ATP synthase subunit A [Herbidospora yilanensis]
MGVVTRVNGPLVQVSGLSEAAMYDLVDLGPDRIPGEIVGIRRDGATVQAYEYTGGLAPGQPAAALGVPLSARLGPHLLGGVFDGLLRPLTGAATWLGPRSVNVAGDQEWRFTPLAAEGDHTEPGTPVGRLDDAGALPYLLLSPGGQVTAVRAEGRLPIGAAVATVGGDQVGVTTSWPVRRPRPFGDRLGETVPLITGQRVVDLLLPVARGGTAAVPGGFGTGKTVLLQQIAKWCDADVVVYVGCGERGNEMADVVQELSELTDPRTGGPLARRTVVIANTSNMPMMAREASIYTGVTVAEHFRDMGYHAVVIADSTSRWAEARREFASRSGALPAEEGYPADLASALAAFYERAGLVRALGGAAGSVTIIGAVSPPGGDLTEPVTTLTQRFARSLWSLDRDLAYARHYPAVSWTESFARDGDALAAWHVRDGRAAWATQRARTASLLAEADRIAALAEIVGTGALPAHERVVLLGGRLIREGLLRQSALSPADAFSAPDRTTALSGAVLDVIDHCLDLAAGGTPITAIEEHDYSPLLRAREQPAARVPGLRDQVLAALR